MTPGTRLGPYEILAPIGAGGMGEVYRARDTKLDRDVAVKVLPSTVAEDPERLARFEREAKVLASLNHPNIAQIYGLEQGALVMELVGGGTLTGPLALDTALDYARQIADALEAAHEKGIIHRDLKPANIKVTPEGVVKVLDFGLATVMQGSGSEENDPANSPTLTMRATQVGVIMGTAAYMSPEQASGKRVDRRADIWSFGVVLWEMLTGKQLFDGETISHTLADVLRAPIDFQRLPSTTPPVIRELLKRCLDRDVKTRLRDIGEARIGIQRYLSNPIADRIPATAPPSVSRLGMAGWVLASALVMAMAIGWIIMRPVKPALRPLIRLDVDLGPGVALGSVIGTNAILSPDGTRLAYVSQNRLFVRRLDQASAVELKGTEGATAPFFSPDGKWLAFFPTAGGRLRKIPVDGGPAIPVGEIVGSDGTWGEDDSIVVSVRGLGGLTRLPPGSSTPESLTRLAQGEFSHTWPQVLPGAKAVLFTVMSSSSPDEANIEVVSLADHHRKILHQRGAFGRYLPSGHLVFLNGGTLFAARFDLDRLEVRGEAVPVLEGVRTVTQTESAQFEFSRNGTLVYQGGQGSALVTAQWLDSAGKTQPMLAKPGLYYRPSLSPDGQRLMLEVQDGSNRDLWVYDARRDAMTPLTFGGSNTIGVWSPDGRYFVYMAPGGMFWTRADGSSRPQPLTQTKFAFPHSFSPDGRRLAYFERSSTNTFDLWTVPLDSDGNGLRAGKPESFLSSPADKRYPAFSPDGRWIAYASNEKGPFEVYVKTFPDKGGKWQISNGGGLYPVWARNGRELFFEALDGSLMTVTYKAYSDSFVPDKPRLWSEQKLAGIVGSIRNFDLAPDGKRVVTFMPAESQEAQASQNHVTFLLNFFDEVRRRVPETK